MKFSLFLPLSWVALNLVGFAIALQPVGATLVSQGAREISVETDEVGRKVAQLRERLNAINKRTEVKRSKVSFYSDYFHGRATASGIRFDQGQRQVAHRSLPFGTIVVFTYGGTHWAQISGDCCAETTKRADTPPVHQSWAVVTDRGPFVEGREFDVSRLVARELGMEEQGVITCEVLIVKGEGR